MHAARIRPSTQDDAPAIAALTNRYIRQTPIHFGLEELLASYFAESIARDAGRYPWLTAEVGGAFAGYAKAGVWRERAAYARTVESGIYIEPAFHGQGVGKALYERLFAELRAAGFHTVVAGATLPNEASARLHESVGFEFVGRFREVGQKFGRWHDVGWWQYML